MLEQVISVLESCHNNYFLSLPPLLVWCEEFAFYALNLLVNIIPFSRKPIGRCCVQFSVVHSVSSETNLNLKHFLVNP